MFTISSYFFLNIQTKRGCMYLKIQITKFLRTSECILFLKHIKYFFNLRISMNGVKISIHSFLTYLIDFLKTKDINNSAICLQNNLFITFCLNFLIQPNYLYRSQKPIQSAHTSVRSVKANLHITFIDYPIRLTTEQNMMTRSNL